MSQRLSISATVLLALAVALGLYFAFAAVQGPSGILRRIQIEAETAELAAERDKLKAEVQEMQNLTRRMSDEYLDLDLRLSCADARSCSRIAPFPAMRYG